LIELIYPNDIFSKYSNDVLRVSKNISNQIRGRKGTQSQLELLNCWVVSYAPCLSTAIIYAIEKHLYGESHICAKSKNKYWGNYAIPVAQASAGMLNSVDLFPMSLYSQSLQGEFVKLYSMLDDGRSFDRLAQQILGYSGPTLIVAEAATATATGADRDDIVGLFSTTPWQDKTSTYGNRNNFLFSLGISRIFPSQGNGESFQWFNIRGYGMPHGIGAGGNYKKQRSNCYDRNDNSNYFRFFVADDMENIHAGASCLTFEQGALLGPNTFGKARLSQLEVWAVGDAWQIEEGLVARQGERRVRQEKINRARKIDKATFLQSDFDKEMFLASTFAHSEQSKQR